MTSAVAGSSFSASIVDAALYVTANHESLAKQGASIVLYLPKIHQITNEHKCVGGSWLQFIEQLLELHGHPVNIAYDYCSFQFHDSSTAS